LNVLQLAPAAARTAMSNAQKRHKYLLIQQYREYSHALVFGRTSGTQTSTPLAKRPEGQTCAVFGLIKKV
jgi:hypothetical protein